VLLVVVRRHPLARDGNAGQLQHHHFGAAANGHVDLAKVDHLASRDLDARLLLQLLGRLPRKGALSVNDASGDLQDGPARCHAHLLLKDNVALVLLLALNCHLKQHGHSVGAQEAGARLDEALVLRRPVKEHEADVDGPEELDALDLQLLDVPLGVLLELGDLERQRRPCKDLLNGLALEDGRVGDHHGHVLAVDGQVRNHDGLGDGGGGRGHLFSLARECGTES